MEITKREIYNLKERRFPEKVCFNPIGIIHTPFKTLKGIPIQASMSNAEGSIEIFSKYQQALKDLDGFSHIYCVYYFDMVKQPIPLMSKPFLDDEKRGVFSIRTPFRPNPIGISILTLLRVEEGIIKVKNVDIFDKTPILDIKPFVPTYDNREPNRIGWLQDKIRKTTS